jgi:hypothetical protein
MIWFVPRLLITWIEDEKVRALSAKPRRGSSAFRRTFQKGHKIIDEELLRYADELL